MANEITIQYALPDRPPAVVAKFKESPPAWLAEWKFELVDETYNGLIYRGTNASTGSVACSPPGPTRCRSTSSRTCGSVHG